MFEQHVAHEHDSRLDSQIAVENDEGFSQRRDESPNRNLIASVSHEVAKQPRTKLRGGQLKSNNRDREGDAGDRHHRASNGCKECP